MPEQIRLTITEYPFIPFDESGPVEPELPVGGGLGISWKTALGRIAERDPFLAEIAALHEPVRFVVGGKVFRPDCRCGDSDNTIDWHYCETAMILLRSVGLDVNDIDFQVEDAQDGDDDRGTV